MNFVKTCVFDIDGTLANCDHRRYFVTDAHPNWDAFYSACDLDTPNEWCVELIRAMSLAGYLIALVSGRRQECEEKTLAWLARYSIPYNQLFLLRPDKDYTPDTILKKAWLDKYGKEKILFVVDDRPKVVRMWRSEGLSVLDCYGGEYF